MKTNIITNMKINKYVRASFTIEAALIVPMFLVLLYAVLYLSFFLYNQAVLQQETSLLAVKMSLCELGGGKTQEQEISKRQFLSVQSFNIETQEGGEEVGVAGELEMNVPEHQLIEYFFTTGPWNMKSEKRVKIVRPARFIKLCRTLERIQGKQ